MERHKTTIKEYKIIENRQIAALLNPRPAVLVTCCNRSFVPNVLTAAWHTPLSHNPPLLGISIDLRRYSNGLIRDHKEFVINLVSREFKSAVECCGSKSGREGDKFTAAGLVYQPAHNVCPPVIVGALAHLECKVVNELQTGDHTLFIGNVVYAEALVDSFSDGWEQPEGQVLLCIQRDRFGSWT